MPAETTTTTTPPTTTSSAPIDRRATPASSAAQGAESLPQVDLLDDTPMFGRIVVGDLVFTAGGNDCLAPAGHPDRRRRAT